MAMHDVDRIIMRLRLSLVPKKNDPEWVEHKVTQQTRVSAVISESLSTLVYEKLDNLYFNDF